MWVLKSDIKSFYESIDVDKIISKLKNDFILSYHSINLIDDLLEKSANWDVTGLPRGLNISATLSEIAMRKFDKDVRNFDSIYYYGRFCR